MPTAAAAPVAPAVQERVSASPSTGGSADSDALEAFKRWIAGPVALLLTNEERQLLQAIPVSSLDSFKQWFWERRDPRPDTADNEFRDEFYARLSIVEKEFGVAGSGSPLRSTSTTSPARTTSER